MSFVQAFATYCQSAGLGTVGQTIFVNYLPDQIVVPAAAALVQTSGRPGDLVYRWDTVGIQILVRGQPAAALSLAQQYYDTLTALSNTLVGSWYLVDCQPQQSGPVYLGRDEAGLDEYSVNFLVTFRNPTGVHRV